jgi:hypothetical protein
LLVVRKQTSQSLKMQKSFIAIALALTLTSAFAAYTATNYVTAPISVAADSDTNYTNQTALGLASITSGNVYLYSGTVTLNTNNASANNWNLFYRQLNTKSLSTTNNNTASPVAPLTVFFLNNYVIGFGSDNSTGAVNLYVYQTPLTSGTATPGRLQLSNNTNANWTTVSAVAYAAIGNTIYVAYSAANLTANITSFTVGATAPGTPFTFSTSFDTPNSLALTWGEALGSSQLFALWVENGVLKDAVVDVSKKTVGTVTPIPGFNSTNTPIWLPFVTDKKLYGEVLIGFNLTSGTIFYYVRTTANGTVVQVAAYPANTSTIAGLAPYGQYIAVFFQSIGASNGTNYAYEIWDLTAFNTTSVQPRKLYLTIDSNSTQVPFRVVSGGYYTLLYNNRLQLNGTLTNVQVGLLLGSSYLASVLGFLLTIVAGLFLF